MLELTIFGNETWDEDKEIFVLSNKTTLQLEHSLVSISKWESITHEPFLVDKKMHSYDDTILYIKCMTVNRKSVPDEVYNLLNGNHIKQVNDYIDNKMSATWFNENVPKLTRHGVNKGEVITSELIYYWMTMYNIPAEYQKWHLNRLLTLIRICNINNAPQKKMSTKDIVARNAYLNAMRRAKSGSKG